MRNLISSIALLVAINFIFVGESRAEIGVSDTEIVLGMANALSGPASALGKGVKKGSQIYLDKVNGEGGVFGRKIRVISYDDGYEPKQTVAQTRKLIDQDQVFSLFGYVGTPTSSAIRQIFSRSKVPYLFPFTGAEFLRHPINKYIFNVRASYFDETESLVNHLIEDAGIKNIGVFIQDDAYGIAGKAGVERALRKKNMKLAGEGRYTRNTVNVKSGLEALKKTKPEAVIMVGAYKPCAAFIKTAKASDYSPIFLNLSFVGTEALVKELGKDGEGVVISQVMPNPQDASVPVVKAYQKDLRAAGQTNYSYVTLEGYVNAMTLVTALRAAGKELTRTTFLGGLERLKANLGGLQVSFSDKNHQGLQKVYLTKIKNGAVVSVDSLKR